MAQEFTFTKPIDQGGQMPPCYRLIRHFVRVISNSEFHLNYKAYANN